MSVDKDPMAWETLATVIEFLKWILGGLAAAGAGMSLFLFRRTSSLWESFDAMVREMSDHELENERRFALKPDVDKLREHIDKRLDTIADAQTRNRDLILESIRRGSVTPSRHG